MARSSHEMAKLRALLQTGFEYITYQVPITFAVKNECSGSIERCGVTSMFK